MKQGLNYRKIKDHYYQPLWTLVGAGVVKVNDTHRAEASVLPKGAKWIRDYADKLHPDKNKVTTKEGHEINYEYLIIAVGLQNDYKKVPGLYEALHDKSSSVSTIYDSQFCEKTFENFKQHKQGNAIFTYPDTLIKCAGAPQKIAYLADCYFNKTNVRSKTNMIFNTCLPVIFGVPKYVEALLKVAKRKNINVNYKTILKEVRHEKKEAVFFSNDDELKPLNVCTGRERKITMNYSMLHVAPPMHTPAFLRNSSVLVDDSGYLQVDKYTLQNKEYSNVYGIGDCINSPNSKSAAAVSVQCYVLEQNLLSTMHKDEPKQKYNGYSACPLLTSYSTCILAEFIYEGIPRETLPFNQSNESRLAFYMKKHLFPFLYWNFLLKGYYHGPEKIRRMLNPFRN